jgi:hypothetical protein
MKEVEYKKELQNRTIDPSPDSWERLNNKLTAHQNKQNTKKRSWLKYTAVIVVLVSVGIYFLRPDSHVIDIQSK